MAKEGKVTITEVWVPDADGSIIVNHIPYKLDGRYIGAPWPIEWVSREEMAKRYPKA